MMRESAGTTDLAYIHSIVSEIIDSTFIETLHNRMAKEIQSSTIALFRQFSSLFYLCAIEYKDLGEQELLDEPVPLPRNQNPGSLL